MADTCAGCGDPIGEHAGVALNKMIFEGRFYGKCSVKECACKGKAVACKACNDPITEHEQFGLVEKIFGDYFHGKCLVKGCDCVGEKADGPYSTAG